MNSEKAIQQIKAILKEPYSISDLDAWMGRVLPFSLLILTLFGSLLTAFTSWQTDSTNANVESAFATAKLRQDKFKAIISPTEAFDLASSSKVLSADQVKVLQGIADADDIQIASYPVEEAKDRESLSGLSFRLYFYLAGFLISALLILLGRDLVNGLNYRFRTRGIDEAAFRVYDRIIAGLDFSRAAIESVTLAEALNLLRLRRETKVARIYHLFQSELSSPVQAETGDHLERTESFRIQVEIPHSGCSRTSGMEISPST